MLKIFLTNGHQSTSHLYCLACRHIKTSFKISMFASLCYLHTVLVCRKTFHIRNTLFIRNTNASQLATGQDLQDLWKNYDFIHKTCVFIIQLQVFNVRG